MPVHELVQVEQVLQQLPGGRERRGHQLDQRLGVVGRDVLVGERGAQRARVRCLREPSIGRHAQGLLLHALAPTLQDFGLPTVHESGQAPLKHTIYGGGAHPFSIRSIVAAGIER